MNTPPPRFHVLPEHQDAALGRDHYFTVSTANRLKGQLEDALIAHCGATVAVLEARATGDAEMTLQAETELSEATCSLDLARLEWELFGHKLLLRQEAKR